MYLGVDRQYESLLHHTLLFSKDWQANFADIFDDPRWPNDPSIYVCAPGKTDPSVAPNGMENIFVLVPIAPGLDDTVQMRNIYADKVIATMESQLGLTDLHKHIVFKELRSAKDFAGRYNSYNGTGLGLAHTLTQSAIFRPSNKSKKVRDLY
jgi:phytoene desaturase